MTPTNDYFDRFKRISQVNGSPIDNLASKSKQWHTENVSKYGVFIQSINGQMKGIINKGKSDDEKKIVLLPDTKLERGQYLNFMNKDWIITNTNTDSIELSPTVDVMVCNYILELNGGVEKVDSGKRTERGQIIYNEVKKPSILIKCHIKNNIPTINLDFERQVNTSIGNIEIYLPSPLPHSDLQTGKEFFVYDQKYEVTGIDYSGTFNKVGVAIVHGKRKVVEKS